MSVSNWWRAGERAGARGGSDRQRSGHGAAAPEALTGPERRALRRQGRVPAETGPGGTKKKTAKEAGRKSEGGFNNG